MKRKIASGGAKKLSENYSWGGTIRNEHEVIEKNVGVGIRSTNWIGVEKNKTTLSNLSLLRYI